DGLELPNCRITNAVKCLPPQNKPVGGEINECNHFLAAELEHLEPGSVVLALGKIAHDAVLKARGLKLSAAKFAHAAEHDLGHFTLLDSYHCSRYNTNTRRLTTEMFDAVMGRARELAG
ncbi:MAG: uracil-DNA glycosylase family protein, partial [Gammaproteobacteria bacterium]|nr:uracil-DNA glycosylase family protein [Gammaproteobacteria bacterium]